MTDGELQAIRGRCEAATPGPWVAYGLAHDAGGKEILVDMEAPPDRRAAEPATPFFGAEVLRTVPLSADEEEVLEEAWAEYERPRDTIDCERTLNLIDYADDAEESPADVYCRPTTEVIASLRHHWNVQSAVTGDVFGETEVPLRPADALFVAHARADVPALLAEVDHLRAAIRKHRDQRGDDRCFLDDYELYATLGEPAPEHACQLDCPETMLENCRRFIATRHDPVKPYLSPQREIERLQGIVASLAERCHGQSEILSRRAERGEGE